MSEEETGPGPSAAITTAVTTRDRDLPNLISRHYQSLLELAQRIHAREPAHHSLTPASLVHEAFLRLCDQSRVAAGSEAFFRACFAQECRRLLVDHARRRQALRRGGGVAAVPLDEEPDLVGCRNLDIVHVNEAIEKLAALDARMARLVDLRVFGCLTIDECSDELGVSPRKVVSDWAFARSWLQHELG
ncbi:MAG: RNA polymerase subunit sigma-70 [Planctomycetes bacterium]|nr:RNA polymerase subunit sigma-70 [Planctomycetota bacterium]